MKQIMVSFSDHCHTLSIDRVLSTIRIGKDLWYLNDFQLDKSILFPSLKILIITSSQATYKNM